MGRQHEEPATRQFLAEIAKGRPTALEVPLGGRNRSADGGIWNAGAPGSLRDADVLLVQTKVWLTSSVLGQAHFSTKLALQAGAKVARCIALVGEGCGPLQALVVAGTFGASVEVREYEHEAFGGGQYGGAPTWSQRAVREWLGDLQAEIKVPLYEGAETRAGKYDRACAVVALDGEVVIINTQKTLGMSVLGRALCSRHLLADPGRPPPRSIVLVRKNAHDLLPLAVAQGIEVFEVPLGQTIRKTLGARPEEQRQPPSDSPSGKTMSTASQPLNTTLRSSVSDDGSGQGWTRGLRRSGGPMPKYSDLNEPDFSATVELLRTIIRQENAIFAGTFSGVRESNTVQINRLIDERRLDGWDRKSLGTLMNGMRGVLRTHGEVGCFPDGRAKQGPAAGAPGLEERMRSLGLV